MDISGKTFLIASELTGARFLACWSQHHSTLNDFLLSRRHSFLPKSFNVKQESKHFRLERREEFNKRSYHHKLEQSQRERNGEKKMYLTTGSETIAVINAVFLSTTFAEFILTWQTGIPTHSLQVTKLIISCMPPGELEVYKFEHYIFQIQRHDCSCDSPKCS